MTDPSQALDAASSKMRQLLQELPADVRLKVGAAHRDYALACLGVTEAMHRAVAKASGMLIQAFLSAFLLGAFVGYATGLHESRAGAVEVMK